MTLVPHGLARLVRKDAAQRISTVVPMQTQGSRPSLFLIHDLNPT